ncbi:baculoviral IAP repeat-containing protein 6 isoform X2 [Lingula anatina]|uniref:Baculoviral IAP repeat-containing protein 6 isoform X2 n=1 Tax=Lingula anatina TaxID=7574 RepID=A0A1S3KDN9_LINAN|nr:baculoviral IAP repeat-containing protein 6 isoform X2 [Lingula anatina]|eukprot:XP_013420743.1 baculoviral IAP repeat-containing protein 6 isoform X2 [Lingula anatina]
MAACKELNPRENFIREFEEWQAENASETIFLLEIQCNEEGTVVLCFLLDGEHEFRLTCPQEYPDHVDHFFVEAGPSVKIWANALNEYLLDTPSQLSLKQVLTKAEALYGSESKRRKVVEAASEDEISMGEDEDDENEEAMYSDEDDSAFTTEWELKVARIKKRWAQKEAEVRAEMKKAKLGPGMTELGALQASGQEKQQAKQIFTSSAASGILTNDLVKILEEEQNLGFSADPIDDNIYQWCVKLYTFQEDSDLARELAEICARDGYNYIELQMDFAIDLYPFYPPLVKVIRPRLQGSMMQRVTNMEMLKLSYWNPTKDMKSVLTDIKDFLQQWARLEVNSERNDPKRYPSGAYVDIEHHLLRLALVSEVNPRANFKYLLDEDKVMEMKAAPAIVMKDQKVKKTEEFWAKGVGYGHSRRPDWDIKAYLAARAEKDKQIESVLHKIHHELKVLYAQHAPQLKPRVRKHSRQQPVDHHNQSVDPVEDMYNILEGSALIPFLEQYMKADSFLEINRHTSVYKVIVDIIKELALQPQLVPLLWVLPDQAASVYHLLENLEKKANVLLQHVCRAGNGCIPQAPKGKEKEKKKNKEKNSSLPSTSTGTSIGENRPAEEKLAREFINLYKDVTDSLRRSGVFNSVEEEEEVIQQQQHQQQHQQQEGGDPEMMDITITSVANNEQIALEEQYKKLLKDLLFDSCEMDLEGPRAHHYTSEFKKQPIPSQSQVFRIAQELTSLSTSLPLELSSGILVRSDDEKLTLMRALITGPEGTPYSGGCYQFDIFFPPSYPKTPPLVNLQTTGGGTVRFNPNLYNCGKVCLSLLGTWEGQQGEQWNETTSTVLQVLVSIQSLILVPEPYFNEPGYEQEIGTDVGKKHSQEYNLDVQINNIKYAIIAQLHNPSQGFEDVIKTHFYLKRERLIQEVEGWVACQKSSKLERAFQNMKQELRKLQPPPNVANLNCNIKDSPQQTTKKI